MCNTHQQIYRLNLIDVLIKCPWIANCNGVCADTSISTSQLDSGLHIISLQYITIPSYSLSCYL